MKWTTIAYFFWVLTAASSCNENKQAPSSVLIKEMDLKRGEIISCGPADKQFGSVSFDITGSARSKADFVLGLKMLHSFEYDESEKVFARIVDAEPGCAMPYWGIAMSNFHPLWAPPTEPELVKGEKAVELAAAIQNKTAREAAYIETVAAFYKNWKTTDHRSRCLAFEAASGRLYKNFPDDKEAAVFYALALTAAADPSDTLFTRQKKAGAILNALYPAEPNHPGVVHYIIHTYDSPEMAHLALDAARKYAAVAPSSAHALHMPSHIFTRLGLWDECIQSNIASVSSAQCYAQQAGIKGHWDEELHGLDYLEYAYLQKGDHAQAKKQLDYLATINQVSPLNFKVAYAFAAIPSRYALENKNWEEATRLNPAYANISWQKFPWQEAIIHFARALGNVHTCRLGAAKTELKTLEQLKDTLMAQKDAYKATEVDIQIKAAGAWILWKEGKNADALQLMTMAADMEDKTEKHPVTPGEVIPARELLGDMLLEMNKPADALVAYEKDLKRHQNRFNALYGAGLSAERAGEKEKAKFYFSELLRIADANSQRPEILKMKQWVARN